MKKLILLAMAAAAVAAFAMPAAASALTLQDAGGKIPVGAMIVGTSTNTLTTNTPVGTLKCPHMEFSTEVSINSGSWLTANGFWFWSLPRFCLAEGESALVTRPTLEDIDSVFGDKGKATLSFEVDIGPFECPYGGTVPFTYETGEGKNTLTLSGAISSPFEFCEPEEPPVIFEGSYTLTTTNGAAVWIVSGI